MDKGILIGVDNEVSLRGSLPFVIYRIHTNVCSKIFLTNCL